MTKAGRALAATLIFLAGAATAHFVATSAHADDGGWQCYVVDKFPDMRAAAKWEGAVNYTDALNEVASHAPKGTIITASYPAAAWSQTGNAPILCTKQ